MSMPTSALSVFVTRVSLLLRGGRSCCCGARSCCEGPGSQGFGNGEHRYEDDECEDMSEHEEAIKTAKICQECED